MDLNLLILFLIFVILCLIVITNSNYAIKCVEEQFKNF